MDRPSLVHGERPVPLVNEESKSRIKITKLCDHLLHLPEIVLLNLRVRVINLIGHVIVKRAQKIVRHRARIEIPEPAAMSLADAAIPLEGYILAVHILPHFLPRIPDIAQNVFPVFVQKLCAVREKRHIMAGGIEFRGDLLGERGHRKCSGALPCDQELFRSGKQFLPASHRRHEILIAVKMKNSLVSLFCRPVFAVLRNMVDKPVVSDVHVAGRIGNDQEIPVVKRIVGPIFRDADVDVHDLREQPKVIPIIIGKPRRDGAAVNRPGSHILVDGDPAAREKYTQLVRAPFSHINMIFRAVAALSLWDQHFIPHFFDRLTDQDGRFLSQFIDAFGNRFFEQISDPDHPVLFILAGFHSLSLH